jgi:hypothetical protein
LADEKKQREALRSVEYNHEHHKPEVNPYLGSNLTAQSEFRTKHGDLVAEFFRNEAKTRITVPWHRGKNGKPNLTLLMAITKHDGGQLRKIVDQAIDLEKAWASGDLEEIRATDTANNERRQSAEALLAK